MATTGLQLFGRKKCRITQKAERFFRDRGVSFQFVDLEQKPLSPGELSSVVAAIGAEALIDSDGTVFRSRGMQHLVYDPMVELMEHPGLVRSPVVRRGAAACVGDDPDGWKRLAKSG